MGNKVYTLSRDHKPNDPSEIVWIDNAGGDVYVSAIKQATTPSGEATLQKVDKIITK